MKPVDKKDMPKLIALISLTVCSLGYGIYQLVGATSVAAPPPAKEKKEEPAGAPGSTPGAPGAPGAPTAADELLAAELKRIEGVSEPVVMRDPFVVLGHVPTAVEATPPPTTPAPVATAAPVLSPQDRMIVRASERATRLRQLLGLEPRFTKPASDTGMEAGKPGATAPAPVVLPPPQPPTLVVTGILISEKGEGESTAIVRVNEHSRWLSAGDSVGNGFVVRSIRQTDRGSELEIVDSNDKKRSFTYRVN